MSIRTTQCPRSSCSWLVSQPCSLPPNTRRCTLLRSQTLPTWRTGPTPLLRSGKWKWQSCECWSSGWVDLCPCSFCEGPQRFMRYVGKAFVLFINKPFVLYDTIWICPHFRWQLSSTPWQNIFWSSQWLTTKWFTSLHQWWLVLLWH